MTRHRWGEPDRPDEHHTVRICLRCAMRRVSRHEGNQHWSDYERADGAKVVVSGGLTPGCEPGDGPT